MANTKKEAKMDATLRDIFVVKLESLYDVENQIIKALPAMAKAAADSDLQSGFHLHLEQTTEHAARLEKIFELLDVKPKKLEVEAIRGLVADAEWVIKNTKGAAALDAALIGAAQYVEHYEIAGYSTVIEWARLLEENDVADILVETLNEEEETNDQLLELAATKINDKALGSGSDVD
jgi:ferritin-like metal-binding protein YciE